MNNIWKQTDLNKQEKAAFYQALAQSTLGIVGKDEKGEFGKAIGTATFVEIEDSKYVLTAAHVIEGCTPSELRFLLPFEHAQIVETPPVLSSVQQITMREPLDFESLRTDATLDVALLTLSRTAKLKSFWTFREIRRIRKRPEPPQQFVMMGCPSQRSIMFNGNLMVLQNIDYPEVVPDNMNLPGFDPEIHFLTDFPSADKFYPGGYSGSGLWADDVSDTAIWQPRPVFCGMELSYYSRRQLLNILNANAILDFIEGTEPSQIDV